MNIAFAIVDLFPAGGLQRDCMKLASLLSGRGHGVTIFTERSRGPLEENLRIEILPNNARTNHRRQSNFADDVVRRCGGRFDLIVGFGVLKELDVLYCADPSFALRPQSFWSRLTGRLDTFIGLEEASFAPGRKTKCLLLSQKQLAAYHSVWSTESDRLILVPPSIDVDRRHPELRNDDVRKKIRSDLGFTPDDFLWLAVANQPTVKGLDRTLMALKEISGARLVVAGLDSDMKRARSIQKWINKNRLNDRVGLLGFRNDIPELMAAADLLVHPARYDTTGGVILESVVNGLPVITTAECGYAPHVTASESGVVLQSPFDLQELISVLKAAESPSQRALWSKNGMTYGRSADLYAGLERAADYIESYRRSEKAAIL